MKKIVLTLCLFIITTVYVFAQTNTPIIKTYENGITAVLAPDKNSNVVSVQAFIKTGALNERPSQLGLSHFLEHLIFKGSSNYPQGLSFYLEQVGAFVNAETDTLYTRYMIDVEKSHASDAVKMLADSIANPLFSQEDVDIERNIILSELNMRRAWPAFKLAEKFIETAYGGSPLGFSAGGSKDIVEKASRREIFDFYQTHYIPENIVVSVAGNFDVSQIDKLINSTFGKMRKMPTPNIPDLTVRKSGGNVYLREDVFEVMSLSGFLGPSIDSQDIIAAVAAGSVLNNLLEDNLINKRNLLYSVSVYLDASIGASLFYIESSYEAKNMAAAQKGVRETIENIIANGISQKDLDRVKIALKTDIEAAYQYQALIAYRNGFFTLFGRQDLADINVYLDKTEKLSRSDIADFFRKYYLSAAWTNVIMRKGGK